MKLRRVAGLAGPGKTGKTHLLLEADRGPGWFYPGVTRCSTLLFRTKCTTYSSVLCCSRAVTPEEDCAGWEDEFSVELEGARNIRFLLYREPEEGGRPQFVAKVFRRSTVLCHLLLTVPPPGQSWTKPLCAAPPDLQGASEKSALSRCYGGCTQPCCRSGS